MHDSPWKKVLVVNIITMIIGLQGLDNKIPLAIYIQYAITRKKVLDMYCQYIQYNCMLVRVKNFQKRNIKYIYYTCMYIFIINLVSISFCILFKNIKIALYIMYIVHLFGGLYTQPYLGLFSADLNYWDKFPGT